MNDIDDIQLKAEIDAIMKGVENIMEKIESIVPQDEEPPEREKN